MGRSPQFTVPTKGSVDVTLLFGIADDFASAGTVMGGLGPFASANVLPDGSVLLIGLGGVYLHTPSTGQVCSSDCLGNSPPPRYLHAAVSLSNGNVFIAGGKDASGKFLSDAYVFDGNAKSFGSALTLSGLPARAGSAAGLLAGDKVLLAGGLATNASDTGRVVVVDVNGGSATDSSSPLTKGVYLATATALATGEILVVGGLDSTGAPVASSAVYSTDGTSAKPGPTLLTARGAHSATQVPDGHVFIYGGIGATGVALGAPEAYVPLAGQFEAVDGQTTSSVINPRAGHVAVLLDAGDVLVFGGEPDVVGPPDPARAVAAVRFTPNSDAGGKYVGAFAAVGSSLVRTGATAVVLPDASVLVAGGTQPALGSGPPSAGSNADWLSAVDLYVPCALKSKPCPR
jgi:hypothetical protein